MIIYAEVLPEDKADFVQQEKAERTESCHDR